jgi:cell wall-associated NlpC family hydrolase
LVQQYLGVQHEYGIFDCITLVKHFYKNQLNIDFNLPTYPYDMSWIKNFTPEYIDQWALRYSVKVNLTELKNYDVIAFKSRNTNLIIHFGIYLTPNRLLHVEHGGASRIDSLSTYWIDYIYAIYRHEQLV